MEGMEGMEAHFEGKSRMATFCKRQSLRSRSSHTKKSTSALLRVNCGLRTMDCELCTVNRGQDMSRLRAGLSGQHRKPNALLTGRRWDEPPRRAATPASGT